METLVNSKKETGRNIYEAKILISGFDHTAPSELLTRNQDLSRIGWCKVCGNEFAPAGHYDRVRLIKTGVCADCDTWITLWQQRDNESHARIGGHHFIIGNSMDNYVIDPNDTLQSIVAKFNTMPRGAAGMGGTKAVIRFNDGRVIITNDLWHQGEIPADFAGVLSNNATFLKV